MSDITTINNRIDMVYLWCDGQDPSFIYRKNLYLDEVGGTVDSEAYGSIRFYDNEELRFSLRSLEKNAPWINHVFIVTDRQVPKWLNTSYERVTIVDHSQILPLHLIPCFNSAVIERYIPFIPNLSEKFLYGNDDTFFGTPISPNFFFYEEKPIIRLRYLHNDQNFYDNKGLDLKKNNVGFWEKSVINSWKVIKNQYNLNEINLLETHHNIDAFCKTDLIESFFRYKNLLDTSENRFRSEDDYQRVLFSMDLIYSGKAKMKILDYKSRLNKIKNIIKQENIESYYGTDEIKSLIIMMMSNISLFCINNTKKNKIYNKKAMKKVLEYLFPRKSMFER